MRLPTGAALVAGVIGSPIKQSLSPFIHTAWLQVLNIDGVYAPFDPIDDNGFDCLFKSARYSNLRGFNVTAPYKTLALRMSDQASPEAVTAGAANLLVFDENRQCRAYSTDGQGLWVAIQKAHNDFSIKSKPVTIIGAGGAAQSAIAECLRQGCSEIRIINRTKEKALLLCDQFRSSTVTLRAYDFDESKEATAQTSLLINAAVNAPVFDLSSLCEQAVVMDMTYRPLLTPLLTEAKKRGFAIVDGLGMLIEQARPSFYHLYGQSPPETFDVRSLLLAEAELGLLRD